MNRTNVLDLQLFAEGTPEEVIEQEAPEKQPEAEMPHDPMGKAVFFAHLMKLEEQAKALKEMVPGFDLHRELGNPVFRRLTAPGVGLSVEDAFYAVHRRELQNATVRSAMQLVTRSIASGARRPQEHGLSTQAGAVTRFDYRNATREQREDLKRRIRQAAAEGRKIYPER